MEQTQTQFFNAGNNVSLAIALALAGVPFLNDDEPVRVEFDDLYLKRVGCKTVAEAREKGHSGKNAWLFKDVDGISDIIRAFDAQNDELDRRFAAGEDVDFFENLPPRIRAAAVATVLRMRKWFCEAPQKQVPYLRFWDGEIETTTNGNKGGTMSFPSSKVIRADASQDLKQKMGLD